MRNLLVFRTNINTDQRIHRAACRLCKLQKRFAGAVCRWSIDLDDCVLRIETESLTASDIVRNLTQIGLQCDALN